MLNVRFRDETHIFVLNFKFIRYFYITKNFYRSFARFSTNIGIAAYLRNFSRAFALCCEMGELSAFYLHFLPFSLKKRPHFATNFAMRFVLYFGCYRRISFGTKKGRRPWSIIKKA